MSKIFTTLLLSMLIGNTVMAGCNPCICGGGGGTPPPPDCKYGPNHVSAEVVRQLVDADGGMASLKQNGSYYELTTKQGHSLDISPSSSTLNEL